MTGNPREPKPLGTILFVVDERLSRQKSMLLTRVINNIRACAKVELLDGKVSEEELLARLDRDPYDLVLVPWYRYLNWSKVEGFYGLARTSGPTFAGYFSDALQAYELGEQAEHFRAILLDFAHLDVTAIRLLIRSLLVDSRRSGLRALLHARTPVYTGPWFSGQSLGGVLDSSLSVPELQANEWSKRLPPIRICLSALWSIVFEEGPGKLENTFSRAGRAPRAFFQLAADHSVLLLRLYFPMPPWTPRDALSAFWPDAARPFSPYQLLCRHSDFVRVHHIPEAGDVEITAGFLPGNPAEKGFNLVHTLWVEPLAAQIVAELPFDLPGQDQEQAPSLDPLLRPFPATPDPRGGAAAAPKDPEDGAAAAKARRFILEAADKIRELKTELEDKDEIIRELRSGGVGTAQPLPPPDMEGILDAFQEKYYEAKYQIQEFEAEIARIEREGPEAENAEAVGALKRKMSALANREQAWLKKIASTLEAFRERRRKAAGGEG